MLKTLEDLCPGQSPEEVILDYAMHYFEDGEWPEEVILAILELQEPDRTYAIDHDDDECLVTMADAIDVTDGFKIVEERKKEVAALENRLAELPCDILNT